MKKTNNNFLELVSKAVNRSSHQTKELFELCDFNLSKLLNLEEKLKNTFTFYCPGDKETVEYVLNLKDKVDCFRFEFKI